MTTIEQLSAEVERLMGELATAKRNLHDARCAIAGVKVGDIVRGTGRNFGLHRVTNVDPHWKKARVSGNPIRKDGTYGRAVRNLYDAWEHAGLST